MASITLKYDARNSLAKKTIDYILSLGFFSLEKKEKSSFELSKEDIEKGRIFTAKDAKDLIKKCLK